MRTYGITHKEIGRTPKFFTETTGEFFSKLGFKQEYMWDAEAKSMKNGFSFRKGKWALKGMKIKGKDGTYGNGFVKDGFGDYLGLPPIGEMEAEGFEEIITAKVKSFDSSNYPVPENDTTPMVMYNRSKNVLLFGLSVQEGVAIDIAKFLIKGVMEHMIMKQPVETGLAEVGEFLTKAKSMKPDLTKLEEELKTARKAAKKLDKNIKETYLKADKVAEELATDKMQGVLDATLKTERKKFDEEKKKYETMIPMPEITNSMMRAGWVAFKDPDDSGRCYIGKKIKVTPDRYTNGSALQGKIDVPIEDIKGYLCARLVGKRLDGARMFHEDLKSWDEHLYHIADSGEVCIGDVVRKTKDVKTDSIASLEKWLDSIAEAMKILNTSSIFHGGSAYLNAVINKYEVEGVISRGGSDDGSLATYKETISSGYRVGSFYDGHEVNPIPIDGTTVSVRPTARTIGSYSEMDELDRE